MKAPRLGVLGSGKGSNFTAIAEAIRGGRLDAEIAIVLSDVEGAGILGHAAELGVPNQYLAPGRFKTKLDPESEHRYVETLRKADVDLVVLAGFMRVIKEPLLDAFPRRILNIHPSLLPSFKGLEAWRQALEAGASESGCTVHLVNGEIDSGSILAQARVLVLDGDTLASLHARIQEQEHILFPFAIGEYWRKITSPQS